MKKITLFTILVALFSGTAFAQQTTAFKCIDRTAQTAIRKAPKAAAAELATPPNCHGASTTALGTTPTASTSTTTLPSSKVGQRLVFRASTTVATRFASRPSAGLRLHSTPALTTSPLVRPLARPSTTSPASASSLPPRV